MKAGLQRLPLSTRSALATMVCATFTLCAGASGIAQGPPPAPLVVQLDQSATPAAFPLAHAGQAAAIYLDPADEPLLGAAVQAFASDVKRVSGVNPRILHSLQAPLPPALVILGIAGRSSVLKQLTSSGRLSTAPIQDKWESALTTVLDHPLPGVRQALVVAGSDRRGAAFALFTLSRRMGVSPWNWWADVPIAHHAAIFIQAHNVLQPAPSVQYRGIFLNDEDWGLRPWAAKNMDPAFGNIGPNTYARVFELLLRLHANSLWPAMHPGTLAFNAVPANAQLADRWGIVMGSSHSEALLRNNVGEWNEKTDGPWNYQTNRTAIDAYWDKRLAANGHYENFYTVGMRGVHDTGLEATGTPQVKARLVEQVMRSQRDLLRTRVNPDLSQVPQVIWLYKESLELYRAGMQVPPDVTLGWTDDNYGYLRQLPTLAEQQRPGGSGIYYHVSYWGFPHDYLWLCTTPPALIQEEMTKAYDHNARRYWVLNVGDIKPAEADIDYFLQLAWDEPATAKLSQRDFLTAWAAEQFPHDAAPAIAAILARYYQLNFVRRPEFMGFNGYDDGIQRTAFNPLAWGDQNSTRLAAWNALSDDAASLARTLPPQYADAYFELVQYPVEAAAAQNAKFLYTDRSYLDAAAQRDPEAAAAQARAAYDRIQSLTVTYNTLAGGKWSGMMSAAPRDRQVFRMPVIAPQAGTALPAAWDAGIQQPAPHAATRFAEENRTISINAAHFTRSSDGAQAHWRILPELGISGASVAYGAPGLLANMPSFVNTSWLEYDLTTVTDAPATLTLYLLPTFPVDSQHQQRFTATLDDNPTQILDTGSTGEWHEESAPVWAANVLRNAATASLAPINLKPGRHTLRLSYQDPGIVFEHIVLSFPGAPSAYPVPPETEATR